MPAIPYAALVTIIPIEFGAGLAKNFARPLRNLFLPTLGTWAAFWDSERFYHTEIKVVVSC